MHYSFFIGNDNLEAKNLSGPANFLECFIPSLSHCQ